MLISHVRTHAHSHAHLNNKLGAQAHVPATNSESTRGWRRLSTHNHPCSGLAAVDGSSSSRTRSPRLNCSMLRGRSCFEAKSASPAKPHSLSDGSKLAAEFPPCRYSVGEPREASKRGAAEGFELAGSGGTARAGCGVAGPCSQQPWGACVALGSPRFSRHRRSPSQAEQPRAPLRRRCCSACQHWPSCRLRVATD